MRKLSLIAFFGLVLSLAALAGCENPDGGGGMEPQQPPPGQQGGGGGGGGLGGGAPGE